jgi:3-oxoacyl-[acyl-carrier-protein] synthase II
MQRRVVITAATAVTSLGRDFSEIFNSFKENKINFEKSEYSDDLLVSVVENFNLKEIIGRNKDLRYLNRGSEFCMGAAHLALSAANLDQDELKKCGLIFATAPNFDLEGEFPEIKEKSIDWNSAAALFMLKFLPNTILSVISKKYGLHGENFTLNTACASSLQAIGEAYRKIKDGYLTTALTGGGDSRISRGGLLAYKKANALFKITDGHEYIPFSDKRSGFVPGEGAAVLMLEEYSFAKKRGAKILAEVAGYGSSMDGYNLTAPDPHAEYAEFAVRQALKESQLASEDIELISAHGTGTVLNDIMEANLIERVFKNNPQIIAFKSWIGHLSAACGAVETTLAINCMQNNYFPGIRNLNNTCNNKLNFLKVNSELKVNNILVENFGFGGQNSALVIKRCSE